MNEFRSTPIYIFFLLFFFGGVVGVIALFQAAGRAAAELARTAGVPPAEVPVRAAAAAKQVGAGGGRWELEWP